MVFTGWLALINLKTILGIPKRLPKEVSNSQIQPSPVAMRSIVFFQSLGFRDLGAAQISLPGRKPVVYWMLINPEHTIHASLMENTVSLSTYFGENVLLTTDFPRGLHVEMPTYQSHTITTNPGDAYEHHRHQMEVFRMKFGAPVTISNMTDYLRWEKMGRVNYGMVGSSKFLRMIWVNLAFSIYGILILLGLLLFPLFSPTLIAGNITRETIELIAIGLLIPVLIVPAIATWSMSEITKRDSRMLQNKTIIR